MCESRRANTFDNRVTVRKPAVVFVCNYVQICDWLNVCDQSISKARKSAIVMIQTFIVVVIHPGNIFSSSKCFKLVII